MTVTTGLLHCPTEAQLATIAVIVRTIQPIILTVSFHDRSDCEEFGLAEMRWQHIPAIGVNHAVSGARSWMLVARELIWFVEGAVDQIRRIIIRILIEGIE